MEDPDQACKRRRLLPTPAKRNNLDLKSSVLVPAKTAPAPAKFHFFLPAPAVPAVPFPKIKISEKISVKMVRLFTFMSIQSIFRNYFNCDIIIKDQFMTENETFSKITRKISKNAYFGRKNLKKNLESTCFVPERAIYSEKKS